MPRLELRKDRKTGEPVIKTLVSAEKARKAGYLEVKAYDDVERTVDNRDLGEI